MIFNYMYILDHDNYLKMCVDLYVRWFYTCYYKYKIFYRWLNNCNCTNNCPNLGVNHHICHRNFIDVVRDNYPAFRYKYDNYLSTRPCIESELIIGISIVKKAHQHITIVPISLGGIRLLFR